MEAATTGIEIIIQKAKHFVTVARGSMSIVQPFKRRWYWSSSLSLAATNAIISKDRFYDETRNVMIRIVWFIRLFCMASSGFAESENSANRERGFVEAIVRAGRADLFRLRLHSPLQSMGWLCFIDGTRLCIRTIQCDTTVIEGLKEDKNHLFSRPGGSCVGDFFVIARLVAKKGQLGCSGVHQNGFMWVMVYLISWNFHNVL